VNEVQADIFFAELGIRGAKFDRQLPGGPVQLLSLLAGLFDTIGFVRVFLIVIVLFSGVMLSSGLRLILWALLPGGRARLNARGSLGALNAGQAWIRELRS
jgi:hypothetical protein